MLVECISLKFKRETISPKSLTDLIDDVVDLKQFKV